jgi:haloalkane dehalogenase
MRTTDWLPQADWPYPAKFEAVPGGQMAYVDEGGASGDGAGVPVVLVHGTPSCSTEWRQVMARWREVLPGARVVELSDVGHFPQLEAPGDVAAAIAPEAAA